MARKLLICGLGLVLLLATVAVVWAGTNLPPVTFLMNYGLSPGCEPTGRVASIIGVEYVEIGPGCARIGSDAMAGPGDAVGRLTGPLALGWGVAPAPSHAMPVHWVQFPDGFWIGRGEVRNREYERFDPGHKRAKYSADDEDPVVNVFWAAATGYGKWVALNTDVPVRLPSEAEWECACRAGSTGEWPAGVRKGNLGRYAWTVANSGGKEHRVGSREANAWGLYGFLGNVAEWCADPWHSDYGSAPTDGSVWLDSPTAPFHVFRGGSWEGDADLCRPSVRGRIATFVANVGASDASGSALGFRCAFTLPPGQEHLIDSYLVKGK